MTARVTISLPDGLLAKLDAEAATRGEARSFVVQEAMAAYLSQTAEQREAAVRARRADELIERVRHFWDGVEIRDDRPSLEVLREIRGTDDPALARDGRVRSNT